MLVVSQAPLLDIETLAGIRHIREHPNWWRVELQFGNRQYWRDLVRAGKERFSHRGESVPLHS